MMDLSFDEIMERLNNTAIPDFDLVLGIATGGIVPAALVAAKIGAPLATVTVQYRDQDNAVMHDRPRLLHDFDLPVGVKTVLLVDDVSVTGETINAVRSLFHEVDARTQTLVCKGAADYVLFPEIDSCVNWPWKKVRTQKKV